MNQDLEYLVILNDIDLMLDDFDKGSATVEKELGFDMGRKEQIETARNELREKCRKPILKRYDTIRGKYGKVISPVFDGVCYGCFQRLHTELAQDDKNEDILSCPHCGRFLYFMK